MRPSTGTGKSQDKTKARAAELISDRALQSLSRDLVVEAEFDRITAQLRADPARSTSTDPLVQRRNTLIRHVHVDAAARPSEVVLADRYEKALTSVVDHLFPWIELYLPYMYEGINEQPGLDEDEGGIGGDPYVGGVGFGIQVADFNPSTPPVEKWWIHTWRNSAVFPRAASAGRLQYRFTASGSCNVYRAPVHSGSIRAFATIGSTGNTASHPIEQWDTFRTVGWTLESSLPPPDRQFYGWVPVAGSIAVEPGKSAALGFVYGLVVSVATGHAVGWGSLATSKTVPPGTPDHYTLYGKVEYRFVPSWLADGVEATLEAELPGSQ